MVGSPGGMGLTRNAWNQFLKILLNLAFGGAGWHDKFKDRSIRAQSAPSFFLPVAGT
jgi:hypothetical protein